MGKSRNPHKGGRTERLENRFSPETLSRYKEILARTGESGGDLFERLILAEWDAQFPPSGWIIRIHPPKNWTESPTYYVGVDIANAFFPRGAKIYTTRARAEAAMSTIASFGPKEVLPYWEDRTNQPWENK